MKKVLLVLCWECLWSAYVIGIPDEVRPIASSSSSTSQLKEVDEKEWDAITNGVRSIEALDLPRDSKYPVKGREYLQLILDQNQKRFNAKWEELCVKERYLNDESEKNPFVKGKQREIDNRDSIIAEQKNSLEQSRVIITDLEEKNKINQQEIGSRDSIIAGQEEDLKQSREAIKSLEEKDKVNQQTISEQNQVISQQSENLSRKNKEVSSLKEKIQEQEQQIQTKDRQLYLVTGERNKYKMKSRSYEDSFKLIKNAVDLYVASWAGEGNFKERYDNAKSMEEKATIVIAHLIEHNAKNSGVLQQQEVGSSGRSRIEQQRDLISGSLIDATRHDFLLQSEDDDNFFRMGRYRYRGGIEGNRPDGEGEITDINGAVRISGTFEGGFLNITSPITFTVSGVDYVFEFPSRLDEKYHNLISFIDISEMKCSFRAEALILRHSGSKTANFVFNKNYIYVGSLNDSGCPSGRGVKFCKDGEIQEGEFSGGFLTEGESMHPAKRKRSQ